MYTSTYVVIPAYNEDGELTKLVSAISKFVPLSHIVVVDDGSRIPTKSFLPTTVTTLRHRVNLGKGMALKTGCDYAYHRGARQIILIDGDGQHHPSHIPTFLSLLKSGNQIVFGYRDFRGDSPLVRSFGNRLLNFTVAKLFHLKLSDVWCGYRAFNAAIYPQISWSASDYSVDVEMAIKAGNAKLRHHQIPIQTIYNQDYSPTSTSIIDGIKLLLELFIWKITLK